VPPGNNRTISKVIALLLLAGCSGRSAVSPPTVEFATPASATQITSDNPEIPGGPPATPPMPATILTNPTPAPLPGRY
jgi:hypothetical protein